MADLTQTQQPPRIVFLVIHVGNGGGEDSKSGPAPASKASIEALPRIKVSECGKDCSICLEEFKVGEEAREIPCKHVFHSDCVEKWLRIHGSCPVCRFLMPAEEEEESGSGGSDGDGGQQSLEGGEMGLGFVQSVLALASMASLMAMAGLGVGSDQANEDDSSASAQAQDMDGN